MSAMFTPMNLFFVGHYQLCINEIHGINANDSLERNAYLYRAYIAQKKYRVVLDEINENAMPELMPIRQLAEYFTYPERKSAIMEALEKRLNRDLDNTDVVAILSAAYIHFCDEDYAAALKLLHKTTDLECMALSLQCLLKLNRLDLARKMAESMATWNDDATLTQLAQAWLNVALGGEKLNDAFYIYQEFIDKYTASVYLLNGQAVCCIGTGKYEEAEKLLRDALDRDANNYDTLVNLVTLTQLTNKSGGGGTSAQRYIGQIEELYPRSAFMHEMKAKRIEFDRLCHLYRPTVVAE